VEGEVGEKFWELFVPDIFFDKVKALIVFFQLFPIKVCWYIQLLLLVLLLMLPQPGKSTVKSSGYKYFEHITKVADSFHLVGFCFTKATHVLLFTASGCSSPKMLLMLPHLVVISRAFQSVLSLNCGKTSEINWGLEDASYWCHVTLHYNKGLVPCSQGIGGKPKSPIFFPDFLYFSRTLKTEDLTKSSKYLHRIALGVNQIYFSEIGG